MPSSPVDIIKRVARDEEMTYTNTEKVFYSQFRFIAAIIKEDKEKKERRSVRIPKFASFIFVPKVVEILERKRNNAYTKRKDDQKNTEDQL